MEGQGWEWVWRERDNTKKLPRVNQEMCETKTSQVSLVDVCHCKSKNTQKPNV